MKLFLPLIRRILLNVPPLRHLIGAPRSLTLIRHAKSARNAAHGGEVFLPKDLIMKHAEVPDRRVPITDEGRLQARIGGPRIAARFGNPDVIVTSGYLRTNQTRDAAMEAVGWDGIAREEDPRFREREAGYTHVIAREDIDELFPFLETYWKVARELLARPVGGESLLSMAEYRLAPALRSLFRRHAGRHVWIFTHGRVIQMLRFILEGWTLEAMEEFLDKDESTPPNCSATAYAYNPRTGRLTLVEAYHVPWSEADLSPAKPAP